MQFLFKKIDNTTLIVFRIIFGFVLMLEAWGSIFTGWIKLTFIEPKIHFSFIAFSWLQPLDGLGMYYIYTIMGALGLCVMLGNFYRFSIISYTVLWTYCYLIHKASYNNHYYLMILLCLIMCFLPAHRSHSLDVKKGRVLKEIAMPYWCKFILMFQITCVYFFGAMAKTYPDWLDGTYTKLKLGREIKTPLVGQFFKEEWFYMGVAYGGFLFDLLIIPLLIYKRTRVFAFIISIAFHSFNSYVFQVGVFPYLSLSFAIFFFPVDKIRKLFLPKKELYVETAYSNPSNKKTILFLLSSYIILQLFLPLRQHLIDGNVFWTEEGHKMSWRMMLRSTSGITRFKIYDVKKDSTYTIKPRNLSRKQKGLINTHPDIIWQYAQYLKKEEAKKGNEIKVYAISKKKLNNRRYQEFIDPNVDLTNTKWDYFNHAPWIYKFNGW
ncbi:HTTM domain-containing protein [Polaribacter sp. Asnod1-A03]|uniref:HTTM domain-containing protein n=1 Tax=Polaribacter sp. Asnod1-A03 TaxID=3160581 RepID=UPI003865615A